MKLIDKLTKWIENAPTTKIRILMTLGLALGTAIKYWASAGWIPAAEWLMFLTGMAGLDVLQHHNKRKTTFSPKEHAEAERIKKSNEDEDYGDERG